MLKSFYYIGLPFPFFKNKFIIIKAICIPIGKFEKHIIRRKREKSMKNYGTLTNTLSSNSKPALVLAHLTIHIRSLKMLFTL